MESLYSFYHNGIKYEKKPINNINNNISNNNINTNDAFAHGSILSYQLKYLLTIGWILPRRGSIFTIYEIIFILFVIVSITSILAYSSCEMPHATSNCLVLPSPSTSTLTLMTLCSFIIAFFVNTAITRWWSVRSALQSLMGASQELMLCLMGGLEASLTNELTQEEKLVCIDHVDHIAKKTTAYSLLILMMLFNNARDQLPVGELLESELITSEESKELLSLNHGKPVVFNICNLLITTIQKAAKDGYLGNCSHTKQANMTIALECVRSLRSSASAVTMYSDVQLPYPLIQIVAAVVYTFTIQLFIVCASFIATGTAEKNGDTITGYVTLIMYTFVLLGLLRLFEVLENPLGDDAADFPGDTYYRNLKHNLNSAREDMIRIQRQSLLLSGLNKDFGSPNSRGCLSAIDTDGTSLGATNPMHGHGFGSQLSSRKVMEIGSSESRHLLIS